MVSTPRAQRCTLGTPWCSALDGGGGRSEGAGRAAVDAPGPPPGGAAGHAQAVAGGEARDIGLVHRDGRTSRRQAAASPPAPSRNGEARCTTSGSKSRSAVRHPGLRDADGSELTFGTIDGGNGGRRRGGSGGRPATLSGARISRLGGRCARGVRRPGITEFVTPFMLGRNDSATMAILTLAMVAVLRGRRLTGRRSSRELYVSGARGVVGSKTWPPSPPSRVRTSCRRSWNTIRAAPTTSSASTATSHRPATNSCTRAARTTRRRSSASRTATPPGSWCRLTSSAAATRVRRQCCANAGSRSPSRWWRRGSCRLRRGRLGRPRLGHGRRHGDETQTRREEAHSAGGSGARGQTLPDLFDGAAEHGDLRLLQLIARRRQRLLSVAARTLWAWQQHWRSSKRG